MKAKALVIYKEYQLHTILFTLRSVIWYFVSKYKLYELVPIVLLIIHGLVDISSYFYGTEGITTVRVQNDYTDIRTIIVHRLFSYYQLLAIACLLSASELNLINTAFNLLIAIQSSAFLMTLVRKNIIHSYTHILIYSLCLLLSTIYMYMNYDKNIFVGALIVFLLRMCKINKYILWTLFYNYGSYISVH
jgi:hypothetical protein